MKKELTKPDQILIAIYIEYQNDIPDMDKNITFKNLNMDYEVFKRALKKLDDLRYITKAGFYTGGLESTILSVKLTNMSITENGISYIEELLDINKDYTRIDKLEKIKPTIAEFGSNFLSDTISKTIAALLKN